MTDEKPAGPKLAADQRTLDPVEARSEGPIAADRRTRAKGKSRKKRGTSIWGLFVRLTGLVFGLGVVALLAVVGFGAYYLNKQSKDLPSHDILANYEPPVTTRVYGGDGSLVAEFATESRLFVPISAIPEHVKNAFVAGEDQNFYTHDGLDYRAIVRGMIIQNAINKITGKGRRLIGASTITQQVAKNFLLTDDRKIERKVREWLLARRIENTFSKDQILELYLNEIYLGNRAYGVASAALNYFNKPLSELSTEEAAYLAALPKAPSNYHPIGRRQQAIDRRNYIIGRMFEDGMIDEQEHNRALDSEFNAALAPPLGAREWATQYFAEQVRKEVAALYGVDALYHGGLAVRTTLDPHLQRTAGIALRRWLVEYDMRHGWRGPIANIEPGEDWQANFSDKAKALTSEKVIGNDLAPWRPALVLGVKKKEVKIGFADGSIGKIRTEGFSWAKEYLSADSQGEEISSSEEILTRGDIIYADPFKNEEGDVVEGDYFLRQVPAINGGFVAIDPHTGRVLAMVGGFSFQLSEFNRAKQALRQPGSTFKPFIYSLALDSGYSPSSLVLDAPFVAPTVGNKWWRPGNYVEGRFGGPSTLRHGIEKSRNTMTARLAQDLGIQKIISYVSKFNLSNNMPRELAISLGSAETSLLKITSAYAIFVNGGKQIEPVLIDRVQDRSGKTIYRRDQRECPECNVVKWDGQTEPVLPDNRPPILDPRTAYQMVSILEGVVRRGTGSAVRRILDKPTAGKTGTTNDYKDAWFVGFSPDLAAGAYVGFDLPRTLGVGEAGGKVAAPIFADFMKEALAEQPGLPFRVPPGVRLVRVNGKTGQPASFGETDVVLEAFKTEDRIGDTQVLDGSSDLDLLSSSPNAPRRPEETDNLGGIY